MELDYVQEGAHLRALHEALVADPASPFAGRVVVPAPIPELTKGGVIGMSYIAGPKLELVLRTRLELQGTNLGSASLSEWLVQQQRRRMDDLTGAISRHPDAEGSSWWRRLGQILAKLLGIDVALWFARLLGDITARRSASGLGDAAGERLASTCDIRSILHLVLDVHGYQLFFCPYFNADPHPGNILLCEDGRVGLIDFGQCRQLAASEKRCLADLFVALGQPLSPDADAVVAKAFAATGIRTTRSDEKFLSTLARLMFCSLQTEWLDRAFLKETFARDHIEAIPVHLVMAYRAAMLLRGLCLLFQENVSPADAWRPWAEDWLHREGARA